MTLSLSKIGIFVLINMVILAVGTTVIAFAVIDQLPNNPLTAIAFITLLAVIFPLLEVAYYKAVFSDPGRLTKEQAEQLATEEDISCIKSDTTTFTRKLNAAKRFLSLGGDSIPTEQMDSELFAKFSRMSRKRIEKEMEAIYLEFIDKKLLCRKCGLVKPPRTHHCVTCGSCIRRMDHHCPWIANCVGEGNTRSFIQFTFYASFGLAVSGLYLLVFYVANPYKHYSIGYDNIIKGVCFGSLMLALAIGFLCQYQFKNVTRNVTTIEDKNESIDGRVS